MNDAAGAGAERSSGGSPPGVAVGSGKRDDGPHQLWTIGHSTHSLEEFLGLLGGHGVELLCDVRSVPKSRRYPHFCADALAESLPERGIGYRHLAGLGGWRRAKPDSPNTAWRNASFQGYADYALTKPFADALGELCEQAIQQRTVVMCSEALWWRCHRRLIADRLVAVGWEVWHIGSDGSLSQHSLTDFAVARPDGTVVYPDVSRPP